MRADGSEGEPFTSSLTKEALPIIRYRTRDPTTLRPGSARTMRRMDKITVGDIDHLAVNVFPSQIGIFRKSMASARITRLSCCPGRWM